ncbi:helix-turn-helix domain-containing protein [Candidatus Poribacteria bacterium]|nr:helix-turn-helix domain-containing protein [Candidatus Poribacteria bacterium]MYB01797.1 helix-turn-helix domain-containing protein [Candidatus Poribacteria bacterium]
MSKKFAQEKIEKWVEKYPDGYLKGSFAQIAEEIGVSSTSVGNHLDRIIAKRDGVLPSEVTARREKAGFRRSPQKSSPEDVAEMHRLHSEEGKKPKDIAYILGCSEKTVRNHLKKHEQD